MSLPITRNTTASYGQQIKQDERLRPIAAGLVVVTLALAFGSAIVAFVVTSLHVAGGAGSHITDVPLDVAFAAIIGVVSVAIGLAGSERRANEDKEIFDVR